ncbi:hypothetical protein MTR62_01245 [Novosphingobium sp. 1949]|uniref:Lipoprotein n=1 Tax=Novosphingobium organovorum TaxID=2930092 RepID=A0ABT0B8G9_9SPHN|nr:hypothetical protein [Novosphingobium organovorum]MCJ2181337.1 hypothetical protein [Novosphingobium organovorum]
MPASPASSTPPRRHRRALSGLVLAAGTLFLLAGCLFTPGRFNSELVLRADHSFHFHYKGEIIMIPLLEAQKKARARASFTPDPCTDELTGDERPCSADEIARQKAQWTSAQASELTSQRQAEQMLLGGIDPADPEAGPRIAHQLEKRAGWNSVTYTGEGTFDVDFTAQGPLDRDFTFPTFEDFPMANAFVQVLVRKDGSVRVNAPGFGASPQGDGGAGLMGGLSASGDASQASETDAAQRIHGTFTLRTDARILANNTEEGPVPQGTDSVLSWAVSPRAKDAPTALIQRPR